MLVNSTLPVCGGWFCEVEGVVLSLPVDFSVEALLVIPELEQVPSHRTTGEQGGHPPDKHRAGAGAVQRGDLRGRGGH